MNITHTPLLAQAIRKPLIAMQCHAVPSSTMQQQAVPHLWLVASGRHAKPLLERLRIVLMLCDGGGGGGQGRVHDGLRCTQGGGGRDMRWKWRTTSPHTLPSATIFYYAHPPHRHRAPSSRPLDRASSASSSARRQHGCGSGTGCSGSHPQCA